MRSSFVRSASRPCFSTAQSLYAQLAYGVDFTGSLFSFNISNPAAVTTIGNLGITPAAIDFRPGTSTPDAFGVNGGTARLYTVNTTTGVATGVGAGFASSVLGSATSFAFDFNPTTLQGDGSIRIRLVGNNGVHLRLHSDTGLVAATDTNISGVAGATVTGSAYTNTNVATIGGTMPFTTLIRPTTLCSFRATLTAAWSARSARLVSMPTPVSVLILSPALRPTPATS